MSNEQESQPNRDPVVSITSWQWSDIGREPLVRAILAYCEPRIAEDELYSSVYEVLPSHKPAEVCSTGLFKVLSQRDEVGELPVSKENLGSATEYIARLAGSRNDDDSFQKRAKLITEFIVAGSPSYRTESEAVKLCRFAFLQFVIPLPVALDVEKTNLVEA